MRFDLRLLRLAAIAGCGCLILYILALASTSTSVYQHVSALKFNYGWTANDGDRSSESNSTLPAEPPNSTYELWQFWSQAFADARPNANRIHLRSNAGNKPITAGDTSPREAGPDRVINSKEDIAALSAAHAVFLKTLKEQENCGEDAFNGKGVVMVGGGEYFGPAIVGIHMLRKTGSQLPVEVFVADRSEWEDQVCDEYLPKLGAKCFVITDFLQTETSKEKFEVTHYQLKSLAMLFCSFADVLYLDSDSIPLLNPELELFEREPYTSTGLVIWPDFWISSESPLFYDIVGLPGFPTNLPKSSSEAGQLLINKKTQLKTLLLANYYNVYGPEWYYPLLSQGALGQGDKETFLAAATVLEKPWYRVHTRVEAVGRWQGGKEKGTGMVQHHPYDDMRQAQADLETQRGEIVVRPAFLHANTPKMNAGHLIDEGDLVDGESKLRMLGPLDEQTREFGYDVEKTIWELLVQTGCELQHILRDWKKRERMCERLEQHWKDVFGNKDALQDTSRRRR